MGPARDLLQYNCQPWSRQCGLPVNGIHAITQSNDGYVWLGTSVGLVRFDGIDFKLSIWVACAAGIFRVKDGSFTEGTAKREFIEPHVQMICEDSEGVVLGALLAGIVRLKDNQIRCISRKDGLFDDNIYDRSGRLGEFVGDSGRGVFRVSVGRKSQDGADLVSQR